MLTTLLQVLHILVCLFLMFVVLLQQGKGGGMGAGMGSGAAQQVFGGRGAGNLLTRATAVCAAIFMLTSVSLAYLSSSGDRALQRRAAAEEKAEAAQTEELSHKAPAESAVEAPKAADTKAPEPKAPPK